MTLYEQTLFICDGLHTGILIHCYWSDGIRNFLYRTHWLYKTINYQFFV